MRRPWRPPSIKNSGLIRSECTGTMFRRHCVHRMQILWPFFSTSPRVHCKRTQSARVSRRTGMNLGPYLQSPLILFHPLLVVLRYFFLPSKYMLELRWCIKLQAHFISGNDRRALDLLRREWGYMLYTNLSVQSTLLEGYTANGSLGYEIISINILYHTPEPHLASDL